MKLAFCIDFHVVLVEVNIGLPTTTSCSACSYPARPLPMSVRQFISSFLFVFFTNWRAVITNMLIISVPPSLLPTRWDFYICLAFMCYVMTWQCPIPRVYTMSYLFFLGIWLGLWV